MKNSIGVEKHDIVQEYGLVAPQKKSKLRVAVLLGVILIGMLTGASLLATIVLAVGAESVISLR